MRHYRTEAVTDNIVLVKGKNEGRFPNSHSILILDNETVLIDTGCGIETLKLLRKDYEVNYVINSHTHPDHSAGNWIFKDKPIFVPKEGYDTSGNIIALSERFTNKRLAPIWQRFVKGHLQFRDCKPTNTYENGQVFDFGETKLSPIYSPGHTKDHYCFYESKEGIVLSFDYDLTSFPWYGHRESNLTEFEGSLTKLVALSPKVVLSSHRGIITKNISEEFDKYRRTIDERDERILSLLENGKTLNQLARCAPIYGKFPYARPLLQYWERQMVKKHLQRLITTGKIGKESKSTYRIRSPNPEK